MANTLLTPSIIARESIMVLENNLVAAGLVHRDFSNEFASVGDTISVRKPATFTAQAYNGSSVTKQDASETSVPVKLDKHMDVTFAVTSKELTLSVQDFSEQFIQPAMRAHAQAVDAAVCGLFAAVPYTYDSTASFGSLACLTGARKSLNDRKVPFDNRNMIVGTTADAALLGQAALNDASKAGTTDALRNANIGRVMGFDIYTDQNVVNRTAGTGTVLIDLVAGYNAGDTAIHVDGVTTALAVGDALTIAGKPYVVVTAGALATADQDITIYPGLAASVADNAPVTVVKANTAVDENIAFHKNAFALVTRPLAKPMSATNAEIVNYKGIAIRVTYAWDKDLKSDVVSLDCLWGVKALTPEMAVRVHG